MVTAKSQRSEAAASVAGAIPALGFGTLIPDAAETRSATRIALEAGFRHLDPERYRNEEQVRRGNSSRY